MRVFRFVSPGTSRKRTLERAISFETCVSRGSVNRSNSAHAAARMSAFRCTVERAVPRRDAWRRVASHSAINFSI